MDMLERHSLVRNKPIVYYHRFTTSYHSDSDEIYIFCEGDVDFSYYGEVINHRFPSRQINKCAAECKNNVLKIWEKINWQIYEPQRVLFFVDRDLSYWAGEKQFYSSNVYITDGYSFENDAVNARMFIKCLEDLYGFANCSFSEKNKLRDLFEKKWKSFVDGSYELMAFVYYKYVKENCHTASKLTFNKCISIENDNIWKDIVCEEKKCDYYRKSLEIDEDYSREEIKDIIQRFTRENENYSVRGKWCVDFFIKLMDYVIANGMQFAPSLYDGIKKEPNRIIELSKRGAMSILGPKIFPPQSLIHFLDYNLKEE